MKNSLQVHHREAHAEHWLYRDKLTWEQWHTLLVEFVNKNGTCPTSKEKYKNSNIGKWLSTQKEKIISTNCAVYKLLAKNDIIKEELNRYLITKEANKDKDKLTWEQSHALLVEFVNKNGKCPTWKEKYKNSNIGLWLRNQKRQIISTNCAVYKILAKNAIIKEELNKFLINKEANKDKDKLTWEQWHTLLVEFVNKNGTYPTYKEKYKNSNIGLWLHTQKNKIISTNCAVYKLLAKNDIIKEELNRYLITKEANKDKDKLTWEQSHALLVEFVNKNGQCPTQKEKYKNSNIGMWLHHQKKKIISTNCDVYKLLAKNAIIKEELNRFLSSKKKRIFKSLKV